MKRTLWLLFLFTALAVGLVQCAVACDASDQGQFTVTPLVEVYDYPADWLDGHAGLDGIEWAFCKDANPADATRCEYVWTPCLVESRPDVDPFGNPVSFEVRFCPGMNGVDLPLQRWHIEAAGKTVHTYAAAFLGQVAVSGWLGPVTVCWPELETF